jgi:hypothetical protein
MNTTPAHKDAVGSPGGADTATHTLAHDVQAQAHQALAVRKPDPSREDQDQP